MSDPLKRFNVRVDLRWPKGVKSDSRVYDKLHVLMASAGFIRFTDQRGEHYHLQEAEYEAIGISDATLESMLAKAVSIARTTSLDFGVRAIEHEHERVKTHNLVSADPKEVLAAHRSGHPKRKVAKQPKVKPKVKPIRTVTHRGRGL